MKFDESKVTYELIVQQDDIPVRGNAMASGDVAYDKRVEGEIIRRLENGDVWAWAHVIVIAHYDGIDDVHGCDHLGCCSYRDEADFCQPGGYYDDMKAVAVDDLRAKMEAIAAVVCG